MVESSPTNDILTQIEMDTTGLSSENRTLAQCIVRSVLRATEKLFEQERRRHEAEVEGLKTQIRDLMEEKDDLEQYGRRNTIVISGPAVPIAPSHEDTYDTSLKLINEKTGVQTRREDIDVCHRLGKARSGAPDRRAIIIKFVRREHKHKILQACRIKKPTNLSFNESLTSVRSKILYVVRKLKSESQVSSWKTEDGNIRVFTPVPEETNRFHRITLNTRRQLDEFMLTKFGYNSTRYLKEEEWAKKYDWMPKRQSTATE